MAVPGEGSTFRNVFYALGYALGEGEARRGGRARAPREAQAVPSGAAPEPTADAAAREAWAAGTTSGAEAAARDRWTTVETGGESVGTTTGAEAGPGAVPVTDPATEEPLTPEAAAVAALGAAASAWLLSRVLRPHRVNWPRAIVAGLAGTALMKLAETIERRLSAPSPGAAPVGPALAPGAAETGPGPRTGVSDDVVALTPTGDSLDYASGIATAAAYGAILYPRLPGSPTTRALVFSALEAAASGFGGTFGVLRRVAPGLAFPLEALSPPGLPGREPLPTLAFGLGLGLYRDRAEDDE